jgi:hypothetical protein
LSKVGSYIHFYGPGHGHGHGAVYHLITCQKWVAANT